MASFWLALALWAVAALSESRLSGQPGLLVGTWVGLFTLTPAYAACRLHSFKCNRDPFLN